MRDRLCQEGFIRPGKRRALALHAEEQDIRLAKHVLQMAVELGLQIVGVCGADNRTPVELNPVGRFGGNIQIAVLAQKGQSMDGAVRQLDGVQFVQGTDMGKAYLPQGQL